ncbi:hypothetical protein K0M31_007630 [Melipona bicolor]|uniref:Uncharacterized protein n=1 Tax=Melipona bicolor TaxID=60889 RepID=A0AA40GBS8_9HYME|nr:hypothetical protein K0M31_007630 [Melipona bicolor]
MVGGSGSASGPTRGNTRTHGEEKGRSGEPGEAAWKKDLDCAAVRDVDGCCGPNQPPTAKNLIRCHNYTQWRSTSARGTVVRSIAGGGIARFRGQRKWFLLMGFMLTNADWPGEEDPTCRFLSLDARFFRDDAGRVPSRFCQTIEEKDQIRASERSVEFGTHVAA